MSVRIGNGGDDDQHDRKRRDAQPREHTTRPHFNAYDGEQLVDVDGRAVSLGLVQVEVAHTDLTEVTRMVLVDCVQDGENRGGVGGGRT